MSDKRDSASGSNPKHEEENLSTIDTTSNGVFKPSSDVLPCVNVTHNVLLHPHVQLHNFFQRPDPIIPDTLQRYRSALRSAFPPHAPITTPDEIINLGTCNFTISAPTTEKIPYPSWCHITTTNYYSESEPLIDFYTPDEWNAFTLREQCSITLFLEDLKAKDTLKEKKKTKVKKPKQGRDYHANHQVYASLEEVVVPKDAYKKYRHQLSQIGHLPENDIHRTIQMLHAFDTHLSSATPFIVIHNAKNFNDDLNTVGKDVTKPTPDIFKGDKDDEYSTKIDLFESISYSENSHVSCITITAPHDGFSCDHAMILKHITKTVLAELRTQYKGCSLIYAPSHHKDGYLHMHIIIDRAITPGLQKYFRDVFLSSHPGLSRDGIHFYNNKHPESTEPYPVPEHGSITKCFSYFKDNVLPKPKDEKDAFAKKVADATMWNCNRSPDYVGIHKLDMSGPVATAVYDKLRPKNKFNGTIYERVTLTKASGNEEDLVDIAFDELPKKRVQKLVEFMTESCPQIMEHYMKKGITDPFEIVKLHWKAHYAYSIKQRQAEKAAIIDLKTTIHKLNFFRQKMYSIHYKSAKCSGLSELEAMTRAYEHTLDPRYASLHKRWLDEWIPQYPRIQLPDDFDATTVHVPDIPDVRVFVPTMVVHATA